ncbi:MAG: hypothetical protein LQ338_006698 [Usnochroma carphineum]|nr:MAG: hypothetical protein LQ338_006698 [Usnochroma carphineum]
MATTTLSPSFLGKPTEICIVTNDYRRTLTGLYSLGIGPWRIYTYSPENTTQQTYRGQSTPYSLRFYYAELAGGIIYELNEHPGGGVHHIAYDCNGIPMAERIAKFREYGLDMVQGGLWKGDIEFAFFESKDAGTFFETITFPEGWDYPEPEEWFPADKAPVAGAA